LSTANRGPVNDFDNSTLSGNFGYSFSESTRVRVILRGEFGETQTPGQTAFGRPDTGADFRRNDGAAGVTLSNQLTPGWEQRVQYSFYQSRQRSLDVIVDPPFVPSFEGRSAPFAFSDFPTDFLNNYRSHHTSYQSDWRLGSTGSTAGQHEFTFAFDWLGERNLLADRTPFGTVTEAQRNNFGYVLQWQGIWQRVFLTLGTRVEDNASFGTSVVPRASLALFPRAGGTRLGATKLKFNFGLGIKEPSLFESFSPSPFARGNPDLLPERTRSFDFGVEQRFWYDRGKIELNLFDNRFRDLIGFGVTDFITFEGSFFNVGQARARGSEVVLELAPAGWLRGRGSYTYLDSEVTQAGSVFDPVFEEGRPLLRRPKHSAALQVFAQWRRLSVASTTLFVGRRADSDFSALWFTSVDGYTRWDLSGRYRTTYGVTYFATIENLLNRDYMEALGFPAVKRMVRAGARFEF
ncbi:MAG: TonB-dependent receptor plug domain-containing protein, partial [Terriglobales bacterium]